MCGVCVLIPYCAQSWLAADGNALLLGLVCVSLRQPLCEVVPRWDCWCTDSCAKASQRL